MIVELPGTPSDYSLGKIKHYRMAFFHFSNNNLSIKKSCARDLGMYDHRAKKSEDVDICFRIAVNKNWVAFREKGNTVRHKARKNLLGFVKQIWGWGYHVGYPYSKTGIRGLYFYWIDAKSHKIKYHFEFNKFPYLVCFFLTDFHMFHIFVFLTVILGLLGNFVLMGASLASALFFFWRYLYDDRNIAMKMGKKAKLSVVHYISNVVFNTASFMGALKHRVLLVPSCIFRPGNPDEATNMGKCSNSR